MVITERRVVSRRLAWERLIWCLDMAAYGFLGVAGIGASVDPSDYVISALDGIHWIIALWGALLVIGGIGALVGRASRVWAIEYVANVLAGWGVWLYLVILLPSITNAGSLALAAVVFTAWAFVVRRYAELNIFTNDPRTPGMRAWVDAFIRRRTANTVGRMHH